jgi:hypothetical protein
MQTIYYTATDNGDGSLGVSFYDSQEAIDLLEEHDLEGARGEGGGSFTVDGTVHGLHIETIEDVSQYLVDMGYLEDDD